MAVKAIAVAFAAVAVAAGTVTTDVPLPDLSGSYLQVDGRSAYEFTIGVMKAVPDTQARGETFEHVVDCLQDYGAQAYRMYLKAPQDAYGLAVGLSPDITDVSALGACLGFDDSVAPMDPPPVCARLYSFQPATPPGGTFHVFVTGTSGPVCDDLARALPDPQLEDTFT